MTGLNMSTNRKIGMAIVIFPALLMVAGFAVGLVPIHVGVGIAVACMLIGAAVMRGKFLGTAGK